MEKLLGLFGLQHALIWLTLHAQSDLSCLHNRIYFDINVIKVSLLMHTHTYSMKHKQIPSLIWFMNEVTRAAGRRLAGSLGF